MFTVKAQQRPLSAVKFIHSSTGVLIMRTCFLLRSYETEILMVNADFYKATDCAVSFMC